MKKLVVLGLLGGLPLAQAQAGTSPFVDVPPCHWARAAIEAIARPDPNLRPQPSALLAENALRQVFEGLKCNDPVWSQRFLQNPSVTFGRSGVRLDGFSLENLQTRLAGNLATLRFTLVVVLDGSPVRRSGEAQLVFGEQGWQVVYASLAALNLPVFPR